MANLPLNWRAKGVICAGDRARQKWISNVLGRSAGNSGDFVDAEAFDGVQDKSLAMGRITFTERRR